MPPLLTTWREAASEHAFDTVNRIKPANGFSTDPKYVRRHGEVVTQVRSFPAMFVIEPAREPKGQGPNTRHDALLLRLEGWFTAASDTPSRISAMLADWEVALCADPTRGGVAVDTTVVRTAAMAMESMPYHGALMDLRILTREGSNSSETAVVPTAPTATGLAGTSIRETVLEAIRAKLDTSLSLKARRRIALPEQTISDEVVNVVEPVEEKVTGSHGVDVAMTLAIDWFLRRPSKNVGPYLADFAERVERAMLEDPRWGEVVCGTVLSKMEPHASDYGEYVGGRSTFVLDYTHPFGNPMAEAA